jgi:LysM repeat protein
VSLVTTVSSGPDLLSVKASVFWLAALVAVLAFHCRHLIFMRGQHRWYHASHVVMLVGMLYMYASVAFGWDLFPERMWLFVYVATSAAIIGGMIMRFEQRRSVSYLWALALAQQGAMIYMWMPMANWIPWLSYALAAYFTLETVAWLTRVWNNPVHSGAATGGSWSMVMILEPRSALGNICMSMMAASMAYMFIGMQLMMSPMPRSSPLLAQKQQRVLTQSEVAPGGYKPGSLAATQAPDAVAIEHERSTAETAPPAVATTYIIVSGDTLGSIATRLYGNARQWHSIEKANRGLDPRRLHVGQALKLPSPISPR